MKIAIRLFVLLATLDVSAAEKWAVLIGINDLRFPATGIAQLKYAVADAEALKELLEKRHGYKVVSLIGQNAKRDDVIAELSRLAFVAKPEDTFLLYYAGHGIRNKTINKKTYWITYDASLERLDVAGVRLPHLLDYVMDIPASRKLILLDHCFSGDLILTPGSGVSRDAQSTMRIERGGFSADDIQPSAGAQALLILAGAERDAFEAPSLGHGVFTEALLRAFGSPVADTNRDAKLSVDELRAYVGSEVAALSQKEIGTKQKVIEKAVGSLSDWILAENLPSNTPAIAVIIDSYKGLLTTLHLKNLIGQDAKNWYYTQLQQWRDSTSTGGRPLSAGEQQLITSMREIFDTKQIPEANRAEQIVDLFKVATTPQ